MSFAKQFPSGVPFGAKITSGNLTAWDTNISNALDKVNGDAIVGTVTTSGAGVFKTGVAGSLVLGAGSTDWPTFSPARTRTVIVPGYPAIINNSAGSRGQVQTYATSYANQPAANGSGFVTEVVNTATPSVYSYLIPLDRFVHDGATLTSASLYLIGSGAHSALPQTMPAFGIFRYSVLTGALFASLWSGGNYVADTSGSTAVYDAVHSWAFAYD